jgi:tetratricopeptide (TPR) repeat protein
LAYLRLGRPHEALTDALKLTDVYPCPVEYQYLTAMAAHQTGDMATALDRVQQIAERSLDNHQVMYLAGRLLLQERAYPNSLLFFKRATELLPNELDYHIALAAAYHAAQEAALTEAVLRDIVNRYPLPNIQSALIKYTELKELDSINKCIAHDFSDINPCQFFKDVSEYQSPVEAMHLLYEFRRRNKSHYS